MRVLLVEDEKPFAESLCHGLAQEGFVAEAAYDGKAGLSLALGNNYDVVILDIMLPGLNGYEVVRRLREADVWTPVLMLTAKDGEYDQSDALDLGADDYLTKPFSFVVLLARLRALVRRGAPVRPAVLTVGSLALDPGRRAVARCLPRGEVPIPVTAKEFALLHFLMRNAGAVVSKAQILDNVWDPAYDGGEKVVEVYIGYLRRKIDDAFGLSTLKTVRGMGYRLTADL
jgi:two-component system, OmpR family, response regulator